MKQQCVSGELRLRSAFRSARTVIEVMVLIT
jgi:hypothetical protein